MVLIKQKRKKYVSLIRILDAHLVLAAQSKGNGGHAMVVKNLLFIRRCNHDTSSRNTGKKKEKKRQKVVGEKEKVERGS